MSMFYLQTRLPNGFRGNESFLSRFQQNKNSEFDYNYLTIVEYKMSPGLYLLCSGCLVGLKAEEGREGVLPGPLHLDLGDEVTRSPHYLGVCNCNKDKRWGLFLNK